MAKKAAKPAAKSAKTSAKKPAAKAPAKAKAAAPKNAAPVKAAPAKGVASKLVEKMMAAAKAVVSPVETPAKPIKKAPLKAVPTAPAEVPQEANAAPVETPAASAKAEKSSLMLVRPKREEVESKPRKTKKVVKAKVGANTADDEGRWQDLFTKHGTEKPQVYNMKEIFAAGKPLQHKTLGWGWILTCENDRLEVLFKDGRRMLISNYDPNR